ncbi:DUF6778 family protein [uncultured Boseongicola sp.]|uniref:DUF6778 family protein n=1 Tax=uncultured Boseongicola sp. TaxID=1648499 RepID=UPI00261F610C|nr:DUF6778 family protein [uncultured Boseongicola sp.]
MEHRRAIADALALMLLAGCGGNSEVAYDDPPSTIVTQAWRVVDVVAVVPDTLSVSNNNMFAPRAGIVWQGEPVGDCRAQVAAVLDDGLTFQCVTPTGLQARLLRCMSSALSRAVLMRKWVRQLLPTNLFPPIWKQIWTWQLSRLPSIGRASVSVLSNTSLLSYAGGWGLVLTKDGNFAALADSPLPRTV